MYLNCVYTKGNNQITTKTLENGNTHGQIMMNLILNID